MIITWILNILKHHGTLNYLFFEIMSFYKETLTNQIFKNIGL